MRDTIKVEKETKTKLEPKAVSIDRDRYRMGSPEYKKKKIPVSNKKKAFIYTR